MHSVGFPEPWASDFPGIIEEYDCDLHPRDDKHGGFHINGERLTPAQRARLAEVITAAGLTAILDEREPGERN